MGQDVISAEIDVSIRKSARSPTKTQMKLSQEVRKNKFRFNKRGRLRKDEEDELKRTHKTIFDWVSPKLPEAEPPTESLETKDEEGRALLELLEKDERLMRMEKRKKTWEMQFISILELGTQRRRLEGG